jgi:hypothetical protein
VAPFAIGDQVGLRNHPEHGILRVTSVDRHPNGWRIGAGCGGYQIWASADAFVAWPDGTGEAPPVPAGHSPDGASPEAFDRARNANLADPAEQQAVTQWAAAKARWLSAWGDGGRADGSN